MNSHNLPAPLVPLRESADPSSMHYATVHAFKGLEAPAVVLTDIYRLAGSDAEALLYVGLTRARFRLIALIASGLRPDWLNTLSRHFGGDAS